MSLLQQLDQLLTQAPGNLVYHLVTLLAAQATLALALAQRRRNPADDFARRLTWAAGGIVLTRLVLLAAGVFVGNDQFLGASTLPPLEQAANTVLVALVVWALASRPTVLPRLADVALLLTLLIIGVMAVFFILDWRQRITAGIPYNSSEQATVWGVFQIAALISGTLLVVNGRQPDWWLRLSTLAVLLLAHFAHLWNFPESLPTSTEIPYWIRLGHLVALPLLAVLANRHTLAELTATHLAHRPAAEQLIRSFDFSTRILQAADENQAVESTLAVAAEVVDTALMVVALPLADNRGFLRLSGRQWDGETAHRRAWMINMADWTFFRLAKEEHEGVVLSAGGQGARQLRAFYQEIGAGPLGPLLIVPLRVGRDDTGFLLLARDASQAAWPDDARRLAVSLATFLAQALSKLRSASTALESHLSTRARERDQARDEAAALARQLQQSETTIRRLESRITAAGTPAETQARLESAMAEMAALRQALAEAEDALAVAAAEDAGLNPAWVARSFNRYARELQALPPDANVANANSGECTPIEKLRSPLTLMTAFTDLLLSEAMGKMGANQRAVLQRMQTDLARAAELLQDLEREWHQAQWQQDTAEPVELRQAILAANLSLANDQNGCGRLTLDLDDSPLFVPVPAGSLHQLLTHVLRSTDQSHSVIVSARLLSAAPGQNGHTPDSAILHLAIAGRTMTTINGQPAGDPISEVTAARSLAYAQGGRLWLDRQPDGRQTLSLLLPVSKA